MKGKLLFFVPVLVIVLFLSGCTQSETTPSDNTSGVVASAADNGVVVPTDNTASTADNGVVVPPAPTFELKNWDVNIITTKYGDRIRVLEFDYSTTINKEFFAGLKLTTGELLSTSLEPTTGSGWISLNTTTEIYNLPGTYQFIVSDPEGQGSMEETIFWDKNFTFVGPQLSITGAYIEDWKSNHSLGYEPTALAISVSNTGDMPFNTYYSVVIDGDKANPSLPVALGEPIETGKVDRGYGWVRPGQWTFKVPFGWTLSRGTHDAEIRLVDPRNDKVITTHPITVQTP